MEIFPLLADHRSKDLPDELHMLSCGPVPDCFFSPIQPFSRITQVKLIFHRWLCPIEVLKESPDTDLASRFQHLLVLQK